MHLRKLVLPAIVLLAACSDDPTSPNGDLSPQFDHTTPGAPPATINVNNYTAEFHESGLTTFYRGSGMLFNGGISYGTDATTVHFVNTANGYFDIAQTGYPVQVSSYPGVDHYSSTVMTEQPSQALGLKNELGIVTVRETFASGAAPHDDYIIVKYSLTNATTAPISNLHVGYLADPDVYEPGVGGVTENIGRYDAATSSARMGVQGGAVEHAIIALSHSVGTYRTWTNGASANVFPYRDPTTNEGWFSLLSTGDFNGTFGPADVRQYLGTAATTLAPGETKVYAFALVAGDNAADLTTNINAARAQAGAFMAPVSSLAAGVSIQPGIAAWTARISFATAADAAKFNQATTRCGGATISGSLVTGSYVDVAFGALELDPRRRTGAAMHCGGTLSDGTYFAGTDYPTFVENTIPATRMTTAPGFDWGGTWSPDGSRIAFGSDRSGGGIFVMDAVAGADASATQIVVDGWAQQPSWSSTGVIAYSSQNAIYSVPATGGARTFLIGNGTDPRFSPDGSRIAFRRGSSVWVMNADGSGSRMVDAVGLYPEWLDDSRIIYSRIVTAVSNETIWMVDVDVPGSGTVITPAEPSIARFPDMSPDQKTLVFRASTGLIFQDMANGHHTQVLTSPFVNSSAVAVDANNEFSPDGAKLLTMSNAGDVWVLDLPQLGTPTEQAAQLAGNVQSLIDDGIISAADGAQLVEKLETVSQMIADGRLNTAVNHVNAFINKVNALVNSRRLSQITGAQLTADAEYLVVQLQAFEN